MIWAFGRLFFIATSVTCGIFLVVFGLRFFALQDQYAPMSHALITGQKWLVADGGDISGGPAQSRGAFLAAAQVDPKVMMLCRVRLSSDGQWVAYEPKNLEEKTDGKGYVAQHSAEELKKLRYQGSTENLLTLEEIFALLPKTSFYIEVLQPQGTGLDKLYALLEKYDLAKRVVLSSPFADTLRLLREKSPEWLTGTSTSENAKARFMSSLFLAPIIDLPAEVTIVEPHLSRLISELERRKKIILFLLPDGKDVSALKSAANYSGIVTERPSQFVHFADPE